MANAHASAKANVNADADTNATTSNPNSNNSNTVRGTVLRELPYTELQWSGPLAVVVDVSEGGC
jgi:hypothetical protein